jgi:hypothetical protein
VQFKSLLTNSTSDILIVIALVDTGSALSYASPSIRDWLVTHGYVPNKVNIKACSPLVSNCLAISESFPVNITIVTELLVEKDISLALHILPSLSVKHDYGMIFGLQDIFTSKLVLDIPSRFNMTDR